MSDVGSAQGFASISIQAGMRNLLIDRVTVEVSRALDAANVPNLLLKGPAIASWLYDRTGVRAYGDSDLLTPHECWDTAIGILQKLGFTHDIENMEHPGMESTASDPWYRNSDNVDLHSTFYGVGAELRKTCALLASTAVPIEVAGTTIQTLGLPARTMHVALHAAQHQDGKAVYDLQRALARLDEGLWRDAADVAARLDALPAFAGGLKLLPEGEALAKRLGVSDARSILMDLRASHVPLAESLYELWEAPGVRTKARLLRAEIAPKPSFMQWWTPLARRGRAGLWVAYLWRPLYLIIRTPAAVRVVWKARHDQRTPPGRT